MAYLIRSLISVLLLLLSTSLILTSHGVAATRAMVPKSKDDVGKHSKSKEVKNTHGGIPKQQFVQVSSSMADTVIPDGKDIAERDFHDSKYPYGYGGGYPAYAYGQRGGYYRGGRGYYGRGYYGRGYYGRGYPGRGYYGRGYPGRGYPVYGRRPCGYFGC